MGLPSIVVDWGGPGRITDASCALKIQPKGERDLVQQLSQAMQLLARNKDLRFQLGRRARQRVIESGFDWKSKIDLVESIFYELTKE